MEVEKIKKDSLAKDAVLLGMIDKMVDIDQVGYLPLWEG
jgi:hypothetical protein